MADSEDIHPSWDSRLSAIETNHLQLQKDVVALTRDVASLTTATKALQETVATISRSRMTDLRTNWGVLASWAGVMLVVLGLVVYQPLREITHDHSDHVKDGHPDSVLSRLGDPIKQNRSQLRVIETRLDELSTATKTQNERILDVEREIYSGANYRAGRPIK